ncbi:MAG TPA: hypothetical protein GX513_05145 [Firmicutes bacterium]|nr:hypothetical protein [Bacillota bacterium]
MGLFDRLVLLATGLVAAYLVWFFTAEQRRARGEANYNGFYAISFAVLLVAGLLLIAFGYGVLASPLVVIVAALIPLALATGLVSQFFPQYARTYLVFAVAGLLLIALTRFSGPTSLATAVLATVHSVAGLTIFFLPLLVTHRGQVDTSFYFVTVGGTLIGIGGIALAFLKAGRPILPAELIFTILAPVLFLMALSFAIGLTRGIRRR